MLVGIVVGTYSTIFIAASLAMILSRRTAPTPSAAGVPAARRKARG
jgi:preprotein translocase subunit SecF